MVDTIGVAVRDAPRRERSRLLAYHLAGLLLGALLVALSLGLVRSAIASFDAGQSSLTRGVLAALGLGWALSALGAPGLPFPRRRWQVPERWRYVLPLESTLLFYGFLLGVGFLTDVVFPAFWMFVFLCAVFGSPVVIVLAWLAYAASRFTVTALWLADARGDSLTSRFVAWRPLAAAANGLVLTTISVWALTTLKGDL